MERAILLLENTTLSIEEIAANIFGERSDFDGHHGISVYNKTDQFKVEDEKSTFFSPKFSQVSKKKNISEWIIAVGRHEGFISSDKWIAAQSLLEEIADRWNRPHRKTNALLSGLMYCPNCGWRLTVVPESDRWTNGRPRFKYVCPGYRKKELDRLNPGRMERIIFNVFSDKDRGYYETLL